MTTPDPFEHRPDPAVGQLLRSAFDTPDPAGFAARVIAGLRRPPRETSWDVLARWARPGLAAAALAALALTVWALAASPERDVALTGDRQADRTTVETAVLLGP